MSMQSILDTWLPRTASLVVLPPWIWLAVRTTDCLRLVTLHTIPFRQRTIWLTKSLAVVIAGAGIFGSAVQLKVPWLLAAALSGLAVAIALSERVRAISPPKPDHDAALYQSSWQRYRKVRNAYMRSWWSFGAVLVALIVTLALAAKLPGPIQVAVFALCVFALIGSMGFMGIRLAKWLYWPCPRCGCAFRGFSWRRGLLPAKCVYCSLPSDIGASAPSS